MTVRLEWHDCTVRVIAAESGEVLESGIICWAFALSLVEARGWRLAAG